MTSNLATDPSARIFLDSKYNRRDNFLINGDMRIDQRNAGAAVALGAAIAYPVDRWGIVTDTGAGNTAQQIATPAGLPAFTASLRVTAGAGAAPAAGAQNYIRQAVEGYTISQMKWGDPEAVALGFGFWAQSSLTGPFGVTFVNGGGTRSYPTEYYITAANTWQFFPFWIPGDITGTWLKDHQANLQVFFDLGSGTTFEGSVNQWQTGNFRRSAGQNKLIQTAGATLTLTAVQLLPETVDVTFPFRPYTDELTRCYRYFERKICNVPALPAYDPLYYYARKRVAPTIAGGGAGFATGGVLTEDAALIGQTAAATQTLLISAEL